MEQKDDWRLRGQEEYLQNVSLYFLAYSPRLETWEHEHCEFCWAKFGLESENLHEGYCTTPTNTPESLWICPKCFADFQETFQWSIRNNIEK